MAVTLTLKKGLLYLFLSLAGGIIGAALILIVLQNNILPDFIGVPETGADQVRQISTVSEIPFERAVSIAQDRMAFLFLPKGEGVSGIKAAYRESERIGRGFVVTNDGWFITSKEVFTRYGKKLVIYSPTFDVLSVYPIERVVEDSHSNLAFFKVALTKELGVVSFMPEEEIVPGAPFVLAEDDKTIHLGAAVNVFKNTSDIFRSSEEPVGFINFETFGELPALPGAALFDASGRLAAIEDASKKFFFTDWELLLGELLKGEKFTRTYLGVTYVDLGTFVGMRDKGVPSQTYGAWLKGGDGALAVKKGSPAFLSGLKEGDVIIAVENERITNNTSLTTLISEYHPGDKVTLSILRDTSNSMDVEVTLGSY